MKASAMKAMIAGLAVLAALAAADPTSAPRRGGGVVASARSVSVGGVTASARSAAEVVAAPRGAVAANARLYGVDYEEDGAEDECFQDGDYVFQDGEWDFGTLDDDRVETRFGEEVGAAERGTWKKCLPVPMSAIGNALNSEGGLQRLYKKLHGLHFDYCSHVNIDLNDPDHDELLAAVSQALAQEGEYADRTKARTLLTRFFVLINRYIDSIKLVARASDSVMKVLNGTMNRLDKFGIYSDEIDNPFIEPIVFLEELVQTDNDMCKNDDLKRNYMMHELKFGFDDEGVLNIVDISVDLEEEEYALSAEFQLCPDGETAEASTGGACLWILNQEQYDNLPDDQRGGFANTKLHEDIDDILPLKTSYFNPDTSGKLAARNVFTKGIANAIRNKDMYIHCHVGAEPTAMLRTYTYQHDADRLYPGKYRKYCFCDKSKLSQIVEQCDCTLNYAADNGCNTNEDDDVETVVADAEGYFLGFEESIQGKDVCCRNCGGQDCAGDDGY